ncbi:UDP-N-acetylmuramoyl-L-alanyl-D-glutamate--2,6-diaminopimelate ligase [Aporhodopirellula aestuarii]|uniref:UDP-N-acetylmuramoyl-L-alanyl-D-glutamate--2, 6-diaminopimelate ligase n=1 Tax=Aporhodopirellula aestuarii TaxID=2950107 RepID=A0ABT0TZV4_9BACT|nr:UDP-N-acetylmuramoyl-L-alanyl-D-glutamate--2,6-diaminopimelate ligase [Aporhodopirellula aestuarii]MCM2370086.1 UDP-N-acetylmuramoyl-L-alanyl-D-glutamate--2,6-diaminopimelate ligase [Aporhodopirellula aestuarii]
MHHSINRSIEFLTNRAHIGWQTPVHREPTCTPDNSSTSDTATKTLEKISSAVARISDDQEQTDATLTDSDSDAAETDSPIHSLASLLPQARFFTGTDIAFYSIAESAEQCTPGQLVVYRLGIDCPVELIAQAMARGAAGILTEQVLPVPLPQCIVCDTDRALAEIAAKQLIDENGSRPDQRLLTIGIVGENGKSTTALCLAQVLRDVPCRVAYHTDLGHSDGITSEASEQPLAGDAEIINRVSEAADAGAAVTILELDAQVLRCGGYDQIGLDILVIVGRNSARCDFGPSPVDCAIERVTADGIIVVSVDDRRSMRTVEASGHSYLTYGVEVDADVTLKTIDIEDGALNAMLRNESRSAMFESLLGQGVFTESLVAAAAVGVATDNPLVQVAESLGKLRELPGRCQRVTVDEWNIAQAAPSMVLDVAGSPRRVSFVLDAMRRQMQSASPACLPMNAKVHTGSSQRAKMWCVLALSASDDLDTLAQYGRLMETMPDHCVLTCAPDAKEQFLSLSHGVLDGVENCAAMRLVADQERAIAWATQCAGPNDMVVALGGINRKSAHAQREDALRLQRLMENLMRDAGGDSKTANHGPAQSQSTTVEHASTQLKIFNPEG